MKAVSIVGPKKSGKTTLGVELAKTLKTRGHSVSAAKFSHHDLAWAEADTSQYAAICDAVAGIGPNETFVRWDNHRFLPDILPLLSADVLLVEGGKTLGFLPRILCLNDKLEDGIDWLMPELAISTWGERSLPDVPHALSVDELADIVMAKGFFLPGMDCETCGRPDCLGLAKDIVKGTASPEACLALHNSIEVSINGAPLGMKPFVEDIVSAAIREMIRTLKGYSPGKATIKLDV